MRPEQSGRILPKSSPTLVAGFFYVQMSGIGRLQPFDLLNFKKFEGPLSVKAVIQNLAPETRLTNDR